MRGPDGAPAALIAQAKAVAKVVASLRRYFDAPGEAEASLTRKARLAARKTRESADAALETWSGKRGDWLMVSAALAELADEAGWAVEEREIQARLGIVGRRSAEALEGATAALIEALNEPGAPGEALAQAKNKALRMEDIKRMTQKKALQQPKLAAELSARAVLDHLSLAAEAVHKAADAVAARFAGAS